MLWTLPVPIIHQKFFLAYANLVGIFAFCENAKTLSTVNIDAPRLVFFIFQVLM